MMPRYHVTVIGKAEKTVLVYAPDKETAERNAIDLSFKDGFVPVAAEASEAKGE